MIDWKRKCIELATAVREHEKGRMIVDKQYAWIMARELLKLAKEDDTEQAIGRWNEET